MPLYETFGISHSYELTNKFKPEVLKKIYEEYRQFFGLDAIQFDAQAFEKFEQGRISKSNDLIKDLTPKTQTGEEAKKAVAQQINEALVVEKDFIMAKKEYENSLKYFDQLIQKIPTDYKAQDLIDTMYNIKDAAISAIKAQHAKELKIFKDETSNEYKAFTKQLTDALEIDPKLEAKDSDHSSLEAGDKPKTPEEQVAQARDKMCKALEESHTKQLDEFTKSSDEQIKKLHDAASTQLREFLFVMHYFKNASEEEKNRLRDLMGNSSGAGVNAQYGGQGPEDLHGLRISSLGSIKTMTGNTITIQDGSYTLSMPTIGLGISLFYYQGRSQNPKVDLLTLSSAIRAISDSITFEVAYDNPQVQQKMAKLAYESALESGFSPDKVTIKIAGNVVKIEELFKDAPKQLAELKKQASSKKEEFDQLTKIEPRKVDPNNTLTQQAISDGIKKVKAELKTVTETAEKAAEDAAKTATKQTPP